MKRFNFRKAAPVALVLSAASAPALAGGTPVMDPVVFPLDITSIVGAIGAAGAIMLSAWAGLWVAFRLIKKLIKRVGAAV